MVYSDPTCYDSSGLLEDNWLFAEESSAVICVYNNEGWSKFDYKGDVVLNLFSDCPSNTESLAAMITWSYEWWCRQWWLWYNYLNTTNGTVYAVISGYDSDFNDETHYISVESNHPEIAI